MWQDLDKCYLPGLTLHPSLVKLFPHFVSHGFVHVWSSVPWQEVKKPGAGSLRYHSLLSFRLAIDLEPLVPHFRVLVFQPEEGNQTSTHEPRWKAVCRYVAWSSSGKVTRNRVKAALSEALDADKDENCLHGASTPSDCRLPLSGHFGAYLHAGGSLISRKSSQIARQSLASITCKEQSVGNREIEYPWQNDDLCYLAGLSNLGENSGQWVQEHENE